MSPPPPAPRLSRRQFLKASGSLAVAGVSPRAANRRGDQEAPARPPNLLLVMTDQHRSGVAGFDGDEHAHTPNLDRLAAQGARFTRMYSQAPLCTAARQSLITGSYPHDHCAFVNTDEFTDDQWTLAHGVRDAGFATAFFGKRHMNVHGFERVRAAETMREEHPECDLRRFRLDKDSPFSPFVQAMNRGTVPARDDAFFMERYVADEVIEYLADPPEDRPFFVWASFLNPHPPLFPPTDFLALFAEKELPSARPLAEEEEALLFEAHRERRKEAGLDALTADDFLGITRSYYASLAWSDHCIGRVLDALDERQLSNDTLVVYTSDHGEMLGEHGLLQKRCLFEGAIRVPCLVRWPGRVPAGTVIDRVVQHVDLTAGLLEVLGIPRPESVRGRSLAPLLDGGEGVAWEDFALAEMLEGQRRFPVSRDLVMRSLRRGELKYVFHSSAEEALFDLEHDEGEVTNLVAEEAWAERLAGMKRELDAIVPAEVGSAKPRPR